MMNHDKSTYNHSWFMINPYQHESTCCEYQTGQDSSLPLLQSHQPCVDDRWCNAPPVFASRPWEREHPWPQSACDGTNQRIFSHVNTAIYSINHNFYRPEEIDVVLLWSLGCFFVLEDVEWRGMTWIKVEPRRPRHSSAALPSNAWAPASSPSARGDAEPVASGGLWKERHKM